MSDKATLTIEGKSYEYPIVVGSEGEKAIDTRNLRSDTGYITYDEGFANTGSCLSNITFIDGEKGILRYRGYPIEQLAKHSSFISSAYLIIYGELPTASQREIFRERIRKEASVNTAMNSMFDGYPSRSHPMAILSAMMNSLGCYYPHMASNNREQDLEHFDEAAALLQRPVSAAELAVLFDVTSERRSITLAGDVSQRLVLDNAFRGWEPLLRDLGIRGVAIEPLRIAYRSTREVLELARDVLGPLADALPPDAPRSGAPVEMFLSPNAGVAVGLLGEAVRTLMLHEPRATVAVLTRYAEQADIYYDGLQRSEVPNLRRIRSFDFGFKPGVEVTEIRQVKGLEYDYVIIADLNASTFPVDDESALFERLVLEIN
ncbi:MAG TPA: citrate/2-methylcitrate synthase, partial [Opitutales bacterium]|nr:citrate/2-methylcitrate synthase [Opitutales bacterium]